MAENEEKKDVVENESGQAAGDTTAAVESTETTGRDQDAAAPSGETEGNIHDNNTVKIKDSGPCRKKITIEIPEETIKTSLGKEYEELRREAVIPGFRKGRAPIRLIEKRFGSEIGLQVKLKLIADASQAAIEANKLDILGDPDIDHEKVELPENGSMTFDFEVEVRPEFELPPLEGVEVEKPRVEFTDEEIDEEIMDMRRRAGVWVPREGGKVEEGDQVIADVVMVIEGVEEHEKLDNVELVVHRPGFVGSVPVDNLSEILVGAEVGDEKKTSVEVSKTYYNKQYRGKKVDITIEIKEIKYLEPAGMDAEFLERFGVDNEDDLRENLMEYRRSQAEREARSSMAEQVHRYLLDNTDIDLPEDIVANQSMRILQRRYASMLMRGLSREQIEQQMQQLRAGSEEQAKEQLKLFFIMDKVADKLDVSATEEEINGHIARVAAARNRRPAKVREELAKDGSLAQFVLQVREQKCIEKILENATIKEVDTAKKAKKEKKPKKKSTGEAEAKKPAQSDEEEKEKTSRKATAAKRTKKTDITGDST